jgi:alpha-tubulin suppressor-like RCC1 family protein
MDDLRRDDALRGKDRRTVGRVLGRCAGAAVVLVLVLASVLPASASEASGAAAWGENYDGQLGNGTTTNEKEAVAVKLLTEATAVAGNEYHSLALLKSGKVMAWGMNGDGEVGNGTVTNEPEPVEVKKVTEAVAIAAGGHHSLALLASGKVMAWGENEFGQLGNGTTTNALEPVEVKGITEAVAIAAGGYHSLAVLKSGKVMAWGDNSWGQLGNNTTTTEKEPVEVKNITEAAAVAGGLYHSLALLKSGKVMAWGFNYSGELGNGTTTMASEPVEAKGLSEVAAIAAGQIHSLAVLKSGKVMAWGENNDGQLGNGTTTTEKEPVEVKNVTEAAAVAGGAYHSLALLKSGKVMAWGNNEYGQLGNGTTTTAKEPVEVKGLSGAVGGVAAGKYFSLASYATKPTNTVLAAISGEAKDEKTLTASTGTWTGSPTISYSYQWESCNTAGESCTSISGATSATYVVAHELVGHTIRVKVTAKNSAGEASASSAQTATVAASVPANTVLPAISGEAKDEKTLTASTGTWTGSPTITYSYQWESCNTAGESCTSISGATSLTYVVAHELVGHTVRVKVNAKNSAGEASATSAATATVLASAPANTVLPTISGEAKDEKTLTASTGTWTGSPTITYSYQWESCNTAGESCTSISGATSLTYVIAHELVGHTIRVKVTAKNSAGEASATSAATATVVGSAPTNTVLPVISGEAKDEKTLTSSTGTWSGSPTITYSYQWESCNTSGESCTNISGVTSATYVIAHEEVGHTIRVKVTAKNGAGEASATSAQTATVVAAAPANTALPTISGEAKDEKTLTASTGTWTGSPTISYSYQWESCNTAGESCSSISGATSSTYVVAHELVGHTVRVKVTAKNSAGEASATSAATATVAASAPANTVLPSISGEAKDEKTLTASTGTWTGSPTISYSYQWESCNTAGESCTSISGATSSSYVIAHEWVGHTVRVRVTAKNSAGEASAASAQTAVVAASAPADTALPTISGEAKDEGVLMASIGTWTGSPTITYSYQWDSCNGSGESCANISGATSSTYVLGHGDVGTTLRVTVTASNTAGSASAGSAASAVVSARAPSNTAAPAITGTAQDGQTLTAGTGTWTGTPTISYSYQWQRCNTSGAECASIAGATGETYTLGNSDVGATVLAVVTAKNSLGSASAASLPTAVVTLPPPPSNTAPPEISGFAQVGQTLSASTGSWMSPVPVSYSYQWQRCDLLGGECTAISGATTSTYILVGADVAHTLAVQVTATNSGGSSSATSQATNEVLPAAPVNTLAPALSTDTPEEGVADSVSTGAWTGEPTSYSYQWQSCNESGEECANIEEAIEETYEPGPGDVGDTLRAVVTASNAGGSVSVASESSAAVGTGVTAPLSLAQPEISGTPEVGQVLDVSTGTWTGTPRLSYAYQWESCDSAGENCADIEGAAGETYRVASGNVGSKLRALVTASNAYGSASRVSTASGTIEDTPETEGSCTDTWIGHDSGNWGTASNWSTGNVPTSSDVACIPARATVEVSEYVTRQVGVVDDKGGLWVGNGWLELTDASGTSTVKTLTLTSGEWGLKGVGNLYITNHLAWSGGKMAGTGQTVLASAATGTINFTQLDERRFINEGMLTLPYGYFELAEGALIENKGTFVDNADTLNSCCTSSVQIFVERGSTGAAPGILNKGLFEKTAGTGTGVVAVPFTNDGTVSARSGKLEFTGGGVPEQASTGAWSVESGSSIVLAGGIFTVGESASLSAVDVEGATVTLVAAPASTSSPSISGTAEAGHTLTTSDGSWSGKEPITFSYQWQSCNSSGAECLNIPGASEHSYSLGSSEVGATLRVIVTASDSYGQALATSSATAVIAAPPAPSNSALPAISGAAEDGGTLTASTGTWSALAPVSYAYEWESCNPSGEECAEIEEATGPEYDLTEGDIGSTLRVVVTATNAGGSTEAVSSASSLIQAERPRELEAPSISGVPDVHEVLDADPGAWMGNEPQFSYQWESCSESGAECEAIEGATSPEYDLTEGDLSSTLRVRIGVGSARDSLSDVSPVTPVIGAAQALSSTQAPTISGAPQAGQALTARLGTWSGGEGTISDAYQWQSCNSTGSGCEDISGATSAIYVPVSGDAGHRLRVVLTASDAHEHHASRASQDTQPVAAAKAPVVEQPPVVTGPGLAGQTLTTGTGVFAGEGPISYTYQWERCEASGTCHTIEGATHSYYTLTEADVGSTVLVLVSAGDSEGSTTAVSSPTAVVGPESLLELATPSISGTVQSGGTLSAEPGIWSAAGLVTYAYQWERCNTAGAECKAIEGATEQDYAPASGDLGSTLRVKVTVTSPLGSTSAFSQHTVTTPGGEVSPAEAIEVAQHADPALLAASTTTSLEEHSIAPALVDGEEDISSTSTLTSSTISKEVPGEFSINTPEDEVSLTPLETSPNATTTPTIVNGAAAVFANTWPATDTIVRPDALGATTLLQLRSAAAPTSFSWELGLGADQKLRELPGGGVAVVDPTEAPPEPEPEPEVEAEGPESTGEDTPLNELPEEREPVEEEEEKEEEAGPEHPSAAPTQSTSSGEPGSGLPQPQQTLTDYEAASAAMTSSEGESAGDTLMVIEPPTVKDAEGNTVPASLTANGDTITLKLTLDPTTSFPVIVDPTVAGHTDKNSAASAHKFRYGLAAAKPGDLTHAGLHPEETGKFDSRLRHKPLSIGTTRLVVAYDVLTSHALKIEKERLIQWLQAAKKENLEPFITLGPEHLCEPSTHPCSPGPSDPSIDEYRKAIKPLLKALIRQEHIDGLPRGLPQVVKWGAWNEPDLNTKGQKNPLHHLADAPKAAQFWEVAKAVQSGTHELHCYKCTMVAGEFEEDTITVNKEHHIEPYHRAYIERYRNTLLCHKSCKATRYLPWPERPHVWGLHDYSDLIAGGTHNVDENKDAKNFVKLIDTKALGNPFIWLSEQGVDLQNGGAETALGSSEKFQRKAGLDFLTLHAVSRHLERVNYYMYSAPAKNEEHQFDSALLDESLNARPAYCVVVYAKHKCPPSVKTGSNISANGGNTSGGAACSVPKVNVTWEGEVNPNEFISKERPTTYYFQYGTEAGHLIHSTKPKPVESGKGTIAVSGSVVGLETTPEGPGGECKTIHFRLVASNEGGTTVGKESDLTFYTDVY